MKPDYAIANIEKLQFTRIHVEMSIGQDFPDQLSFMNEKGLLTTVDVYYDWKPEICSRCKKMGYNGKDYRMQVKKKWVVKAPT